MPSHKEQAPNKKAPKAYRVPTPVRPVSNGFTSFTLSSGEPKRTQIPPKPPIYFSPDLWPQTNMILLKAQRKFQFQTQMLKLCKHVVAEMTPIFVEAVKAGKIEAGAVQRENGGGMEDLLYSLLIYNDGNPPPGTAAGEMRLRFRGGLSNEASQLQQELRKSDEWLALAKAIAKADRLRTGEKPAESPRVQSNASSPHSGDTAEGKPTNAAPSNTLEAFIRPILKKHGLSISGWACKANVDFHTADNYLKGKTKPNPDTLKQLADALGIRVEELPA